ncbi:hypothetical protein [Cetobacterium sp.]|uniref:hypothetical protein n=1 Tax=Cetobacterium sp. TaxID=2071632 RepID=UPI003F3986BA
MDFLEKIKLRREEKDYLQKLLLESQIGDIKLMQNNLYITMFNSKMIVLKNSTIDLYNSLKNFQENNYPIESKREYKKYSVSIWSKEEEENLIKNYYQKSLEELSKDLKKSYYQISMKVIKLKLVNTREWTIDELELLEQNIDVSNHELGKIFKRTFHSIKSKKRAIKKLDQMCKK